MFETVRTVAVAVVVDPISSKSAQKLLVILTIGQQYEPPSV